MNAFDTATIAATLWRGTLSCAPDVNKGSADILHRVEAASNAAPLARREAVSHPQDLIAFPDQLDLCLKMGKNQEI